MTDYEIADAERKQFWDRKMLVKEQMQSVVGRYYLNGEDNRLYLCKREGSNDGDKIVLQFMPHDLVGQYFVIAE